MKMNVTIFFPKFANLYDKCLEYLCIWMKTMEEFAYFKYLNEIPSWKNVEPCLENPIDKGVDVDSAKCFDQALTKSVT